MKKSFNISLFISIVFLILNSCNYDVLYSEYLGNTNDSITIPPNRDSTLIFSDFDDFFETFHPDTISKVVPIDSLDSLALGKLFLTFPSGNGSGNCFNREVDSIKIKLVEFYTRKDMILGNIANRTTQENLVSAGAYFLQIFTMDDEELFIVPNSGVISYLPDQTDNNGYETLTKGFTGTKMNIFNGEEVLFNKNPFMKTDYLTIDNKKWYQHTNVESHYNQVASINVADSTTSVVKMAINGMTTPSKNKVYFISKDYTMVIPFDKVENGLFSSTLELPIRMPGKILAISIENNTLKYSFVDYEVFTDIFTINLEQGSIQGFNNILNELNH